jgi:hypothetical protein
LDILESDKATQNAVEALIELAHHDSLDLIAWALSELLERLAKVIFPYHFVKMVYNSSFLAL